MPLTTGDTYYEQWVHKVRSSYDSSATDEVQKRLIGPPQPDQTFFCSGGKYIVEFEVPMVIRQIEFYESQNPGMIDSVYLLPNDGSENYCIFKTDEMLYPTVTKTRVWRPRFDKINFFSTALEFSCEYTEEGTGIDGIKVLGLTYDEIPHPSRADLSQKLVQDMWDLCNTPGTHTISCFDARVSEMRHYTVHPPFLKIRCPYLYEKLGDKSNYIEQTYSEDVVQVVLRYIFTDTVVITPDEHVPNYVSSYDTKFFSSLQECAKEYNLEHLVQFCSKLEPIMLLGSWKDHVYLVNAAMPTTLSKDLQTLFYATASADVLISSPIDDECSEFASTKAHSFILKQRSEYFNVLLTRWNQDNEPVVIEDVHHGALLSLLEYLYTGHTEVTSSNAVELLIASKTLLIDDLVLPLDTVLKGVSSQNVIHIANLAHQFTIPTLFEKCMKCLFVCISKERDKQKIEHLKQSFTQLEPDLQHKISVSSWEAKRFFK
jgi:hypothetical protein